jgi:hypothetical protein
LVLSEVIFVCPNLADANLEFGQPSGSDEEPTTITLRDGPLRPGAVDPKAGAPSRMAIRDGASRKGIGRV